MPEHPEVVDNVGPELVELLDCVKGELDRYAVPVCRAFVHPGQSAPWDVCETSGSRNGQAWVAPQRLYPVAPFPQEDSGAQRCHPIEYALDVIVGVLRCTPTVDDQGRPPDADAVTDSALGLTRDAAIVREVLLCCYLDDDADPGTFRLGSWSALGPSGGCAGGQWSATIAIPSCKCPQHVPSE